MTPNKNRRVQILVLCEEHPEKDPEWRYICDMNSDVFDAFFEVTGIERMDLADYLVKWCYEDFNLRLSFTKSNDIRILKELVTDRYQGIYPHIHYNMAITKQGWMCVWMSERMGKEIRKHAKPVYNRLFRTSKNHCY